jgi:hypothetical protein
MRILCLGDTQLATPLRALGHDIRVLGAYDSERDQKEDSEIFFRDPGTAPDLVLAAVAAHRAEAILMGDDSSPLIHLGHENLAMPRLWWSIDTHLHSAWHVHLSPSFHRVFGAQKPFLKRLHNAQGKPATWLPLFFPEAMPFTSWSQRTEAVTFVGTLDATKNPRRLAFLEALKENLGPDIQVKIAKGNYRKHYVQSRMVINQAVAGDVNNRVFEAMGCGTVLVTPAVKQGYAGIGEAGRDFITYPPNNAKAAAEAIRTWLKDDAACEKMARAGQQQVHEHHLASHRAAILDQALRNPALPSEVAHAEAQDRLTYAHLLVSRLGYPTALREFFVAATQRRGERLLKKDDGAYPWSRLSLAELAVQAGRWKLAKSWLSDFEPTEEVEYMEVFSPMRAVIAIQAGDVVEALYWVRRGLRVAPQNPILLKMEEKLKLG